MRLSELLRQLDLRPALLHQSEVKLNEFRKRINIPAQEDAFNDIRSEYSGMLQSQLTKGNNGLVKKKYITFGIEADSLRTAKPKLERIETDILNNFKTLGVRTEPLSGYERLKVLHDVFNMDTNEPFRFSFDMVARTGLSTKDFIAPTSFDFREGKCFKMGRTIGAVSFLQILARNSMTVCLPTSLRWTATSRSIFISGRLTRRRQSRASIEDHRPRQDED